MISGEASSIESGGLFRMPDEVNGKLDTIIEKVGINSERLENIEALLIGDMKDEKKVGLLNRVRNLEKWYGEIRDDLRWIKRSFIGGITIAVAAGVIIYVIQNYVIP
jgi:hypothetical protein